MLTLKIKKSEVYHEATKTTAYVADKAKEIENAYDKICITPENREVLERFWRETCAIVSTKLSSMIEEVSKQPTSHNVDLGCDYDITLKTSPKFDDVLEDTVRISLESFFIRYILYKWFQICYPEIAPQYNMEAFACLDEVVFRLSAKTARRHTSPF